MADMGSAFQERSVDVDGFCIRYLEAGKGPPLVHLHGAGGLRLTSAHDLLSRAYEDWIVPFIGPRALRRRERGRARHVN